MKRILLLSLAMVFVYYPANAQWGSLIQKAAEKTTKAIEKKIDSVATSAINNQVEKRSQSSQQAPADQVSSAEDATYASLFKQMPALPTAQQLCTYKEAEMNEQTMRMLTSAVTRFNTQVAKLYTQALSLAYRDVDSATAMDAAYKFAHLSTGMTKEELEYLSELPEDQQEAYIAAHYKSGTAEGALMQEAVDASKYLEPLQPLIDQWEAAGRKADEVLSKADERCRNIYRKYASMLDAAQGKERNQLLLKYYKDIVDVQLNAVDEAMKIRMNEQLPIAEELEQKMMQIRKEHKDIFSALLNYAQLTASQYFGEVSRLLEIPEYKD